VSSGIIVDALKACLVEQSGGVAVVKTIHVEYGSFPVGDSCRVRKTEMTYRVLYYQSVGGWGKVLGP